MSPVAYRELGRLMVNLCRLHHTQADRAMDQIGLYRGQAFLLMTLSHHDGMTHSEISEILKISPAAATKVIKRMEQVQYVQRRADPDDERVSRVFLQDKGSLLIDKIVLAFGELDRAMFEGLSESELEQFSASLTRMLANLQRCEP